MKKYSRNDQRLLATWSADCALRVLGLFEKSYPQDGRPRKAIAACRKWVRTGVFRMAVIREASLGAHAAARETVGDDAACFAARAAGHAVGTAHVSQHAFGGAYYALKAVGASDTGKAEIRVARERDWQMRRLPVRLRREFSKRITVEARARGVYVRLAKDEDF